MTPYATIEQADDYFTTRLNTEDWDDATDVEKLKALNMATRAINRLKFKGSKTLLIQENEWPRTFTETIYSPISGTTPTPIIEATCEIAINLLDGTDMEQEVENLIATNQSYASVTSTYNEQLVSEHMRAGIPSIIAWNLIRPYLINPRTIRLVRG